MRDESNNKHRRDRIALRTRILRTMLENLKDSEPSVPHMKLSKSGMNDMLSRGHRYTSRIPKRLFRGENHINAHLHTRIYEGIKRCLSLVRDIYVWRKARARIHVISTNKAICIPKRFVKPRNRGWGFESSRALSLCSAH